MATVTVIGAGVGGLATAARLAAAGHRVTVFEQAAVAGGKLGRHERVTGAGTFRFDTGPSLFTLPQVATELFAHTGGPAPELDLVALDPLVRHRFPDGTTLDSCAGAGFADRIGDAFGAPAAQDWRRLWRRAARVWDTSWRHVLTAPVDSPLRLAGLAWRLGDLAAIAPGRTLRGLGRRHLRDPRLRMLLDRYATYTGADPRRAPAALLAIPYAELEFGGWYLRGGLGTLADALLARCAALGVTVHLGTPVESVLVEGSRAAGVVLAGGTAVRSDLVVANADALHVYRDLLPSPRRAAALAQRSLGGFVLLLGVRGTTPQLAHHTVFFPDDYDAEFDAIFGDPARPPADPTVFVTSAADPAARPDGHEAWFVLVNAPPQGAFDWRAPGVADGYADRVLAVLAARGVDVRDRLLFRDVLTPADLETATRCPGGAIYGTASHGLTGLLRPPNRGAVRDLFLVGGSVHPGGGLPLVMLSAKIVADRIGAA
ncbi:phytoene desaturase [Dactylosporangium aurantiacum]|uniref:4,4'-diaponeurosporene oxygenase n=1 Tax=Dactylosporangium aurantiacum TaxID=35754 RepID=A0A9Q9IBZ1_9ACTN|nr:phytoene desaturase family protein [Dactylosporangium aurantiacum]MDG6102483.1 phytoene desaturase family protein [Dactylosporangium aurantiacum]UWZ53237.1 phytoene desaturase [Dactylosporangium aurantiacum]